MILQNFLKPKLMIKKQNMIKQMKMMILIKIMIDQYFNINVELQKALEVEVKVVIEKEADPSYDHGEKLFDIDDLVNSTLGNQCKFIIFFYINYLI